MARTPLIIGISACCILVVVISATYLLPASNTSTPVQEKIIRTLQQPTVSPLKELPSVLSATPVLSSETSVAEPIEHPALRRFADKEAADRLPEDFVAQIPTIQATAEVQAVLHILHDHTDSDTIRNEAINLLRRSGVKDLERHLIEILDDENEAERFRSFTVQHLGDMMVEYIQGTENDGMSRGGSIRDRLMTALTDSHSSVKREALLALSLINEPKVAATIRAGLEDPSLASEHDLFIRIAYKTNLRDMIPVIRPLAYSEKTVVRIAAINVLAEWQDMQSRGAFEEAQKSPIVRIQRAGTLALRLINEPQLN